MSVLLGRLDPMDTVAGSWELAPVLVGGKKEVTAVNVRGLKKEDYSCLGEALGNRRLTPTSRPETFMKHFVTKVKGTPALANHLGLQPTDTDEKISEVLKYPLFAFTLDSDAPLSYEKVIVFSVCPNKDGAAKFFPLSDTLCSHRICPSAEKAKKIFEDALFKDAESGEEDQTAPTPPHSEDSPNPLPSKENEPAKIGGKLLGQEASSDPKLTPDQSALLSAISASVNTALDSKLSPLQGEVKILREKVDSSSRLMDRKLVEFHTKMDKEIEGMVGSRLEKLTEAQARLEEQVKDLLEPRNSPTVQCPTKSKSSISSPFVAPHNTSGVLPDSEEELVREVCRRLPAGLNPASRNLDIIRRVLNRDRTVRLKEFINRPDHEMEDEQTFSIHPDGSLRIGKANRTPFSSYPKLREALTNFMMILVEAGKVTNADSQSYIARMELLYRNGKAGPQDLAALHQDFTARLIDLDSFNYNQDPTTVALLVCRFPSASGGRGRGGNGSFSGKCYNCGITGHRASDCRKPHSKPKEDEKKDGGERVGFRHGP